MALQRVETDAIEDDAITTDKIAANAVAAADIAADAITNAKVAAGAAIASSKLSGLGTAATLTAGTSANNVVQLDGSGNIPVVNGSAVTNLTSANLTGALPPIDGSNLTGVSTDTSVMENNIAILAFKTQSANNLAKFNLVDQVIDEYKDGTGATYTTASQVGSTAADGYLGTAYTATVDITAGIHGGADQTPAVVASGSASYTGYDGVTRSAGKMDDPGNYNSYSLGNLFAADEDFEVIMYVTGDYQGMGFMYGNDMDALANIGTHRNGGYTNTAATTWTSGTHQGTFQGKYHSPVNGDGGSNYKNLYRWHRSGGSFKLQYYGRSTSAITVDATTIAAVRASTNYVQTIGGVQTRNEKMLVLMGEAGNPNSIKIEVANKTTPVDNATGTLIQSANVVGSAKTEVSGTMIYKDNIGTATLGTDLKIYFTCNGDAGSPDWEEAESYNAITPVYATGIKQVRLGKTTCTSGTDVRYKVVWADQLVKSTQLHGIGINY